MVTTEDCVAGIKEVAEIVGHSPSKPEYLQIRDERDLDIPHPTQIYRYCGGWNKGKELANVETVNPGGQIDFNKRYFSEIDSEEKAYWLGFLYGDGSVNDSGEGSPSITISVKESDVEIIDGFKEALDSHHKIGRANGKVYISVSNWNFAYDLASHGLTPGKTFNRNLPHLNESDLKAGFIRGLFDADGHIGEYGRFNITGSNRERFEELAKWIPVEAYINDRSDGVHTLRVGGQKQLLRLWKWLYPEGRNTTPALERKIETWKQKTQKNISQQ